jgi:indolepyruvate ferredoxin oxidoreductase beta subunit
MNATRPLCVLIGALGGQGGGLLVEWLVEAARIAGFPAQATSIAGVAQRTGSTTYYFELFPERNPEAEPVFSLYPSEGDVDLVAALEPMEAGRALANGFVSGRTTVLTARERVYAIEEKMVAGSAIAEKQPVLDALGEHAGRLIAFNTARLGRETSTQANIILFGAIAGCGVLPLGEEDCRRAIRGLGVAVEENLAGFVAGLEIGQKGVPDSPETPVLVFDPAPEGSNELLGGFPETLQGLIGHALARMMDYQGQSYARRYVERLDAVLAIDREVGGEAGGFRLTEEVAKRLGAWMAFEDVIRVAQLKTRPGRLARIRREIGAAPNAPLQVDDFLRPGREELADLLPEWLAFFVPSVKGGQARGGIPLRIASGSPFGYLVLRGLSGLKSWRPFSARFKKEQRLIDAWLEAVGLAARKDYKLACLTAELAVWMRGYGDVRARGRERLNILLRGWNDRLEADPAQLAKAVEDSLDTARTRPDDGIGC